jgi:hypothetical protein
MNGKRALFASLGLSGMMLIATCCLVATASAQTGGASQIVIRSQETNTGQIVVETVIAAQDGWLVVYSDTTFSTASMIGWVPVRKGVNANLKVNIDGEAFESTPVLWAVLHADRGVLGQLELPLIDGTVQENGQTVMVAFGTQANPVEAAAPTIPPALAMVNTPAAVTSPTQPETLPPAGQGAGLPIAAWRLVLLGGAAAVSGVLIRHFA